MPENAVKKYQNNLITAAQIIEELINLAKDINKLMNVVRIWDSRKMKLLYDALRTTIAQRLFWAMINCATLRESSWKSEEYDHRLTTRKAQANWTIVREHCDSWLSA